MNGWTIQKKFLTIVVAIVASFGVLTAFLLDRQSAAAAHAAELYDNDFHVAAKVAEIDGLLTRIDINILRMIAIGDPASITAWKAENATRFAKADQLIGELKTQADPSLAATIGKLADGYAKARTGMEHQVAAIEGGDVKKGGEINRAEVKDNIERAFAALTELRGAEDGLALRKVGVIQAQNRHALILSIVVALVVGAGALIGGIWIVGNVVRPIRQGAAAARRMAAGDLTVELVAKGRDEAAELVHALAEMKGNLAGLVRGVRQNAESVATASAEIAQGNQDLSQRTEQQAATLQETTASMGSLGGTVRQNAENARQANQLAMGASSVAVKGGEVVGRVVDTMKGINDSSKRIADIIGTIDGIAFQTNILALNAAVEAARAGEQGRGFAVVASEVRSLAQRSAEAAREIKQLISASVERVDQGTALVDEAGTTMSEVVASIRRVTDIMGEIHAASAEEDAGVGRISAAVTQMDQVTQQNAALVEESAAASESLKLQARQLVDAVAVFTLEAAPTAAAKPVVHAATVSKATTSAAKPKAAFAKPKSSTTKPEATARSEAASTATADSSAAKAGATADRRGPNRATNVVRPTFTGSSSSPASGSASAATGTDEWTDF